MWVVFGIGGSEEDMEFYYLSEHPVKVCRDYMKHFNIYDCFLYTWEERGDYFLITFKGRSYGIYWTGDRYRNGHPWVGNMPRQSFRVEFKDLGEKTGIRVQFISTFLSKTPQMQPWLFDRFWERKLDAKRIKLR